MGDVDRLPSGRWQARWRDPDGRQRKRSFRTKAEATRHLAAAAADMARGQYVDERAGRVTVADHTRQWLAARPHRPSTAARQESLLRVHVIEQDLGRLSMAAVRPSSVQAWASSRAQVLAPSTLAVLVALVRSVFNAAVYDRVIASSPAVRLTLPRVEKPRVVPLSVEQVRALADAMPPHYRALVVAQAGLGLRISELLGLRPEDVDWLGRVVRVRVQLGRDGSFQPLKTGTSERDVPAPAFVLDELSAHVAAFPPAATLFVALKGGHVRHELYGTTAFKTAARAAGLPAGTTPHDLRHHFASVLLAAGESVVAVAQRLGHGDAALVLRVYGHLMPGQDDRTRRALDAAWSAPDVPATLLSGR